MITLATESRFKTPFYLSMRKRSNLTDRMSYIRFCDLLAIIEARLTECQYPDRREDGFGVIAELWAYGQVRSFARGAKRRRR